MSKIEPLTLGEFGTDSSERALPERRLDTVVTLAVVAVALFSLMFWWPSFADYAWFTFLCCFPAVFPFCYAFARWSPSSLHDRRVRKVVLGIMISIHGSMLVAVLLLLKQFPHRFAFRDPELGNVFVAVELAVMSLVSYFSQRKTRKTGAES